MNYKISSSLNNPFLKYTELDQLIKAEQECTEVTHDEKPENQAKERVETQQLWIIKGEFSS